MPSLIETHRLAKTYGNGTFTVEALKPITLTVERGEFIAILGTSGSGKSTLLHMIGALERPSLGHIVFDGKVITALDDTELAYYRNQRIGFVFQQYHLFPRQTALRNVEAPLIYAKRPFAERTQRAEAMLERVGLSDRGGHFPAQLSGGQQQRVALARALVTEPAVLLADEPTGALDSDNSAKLMAMFSSLNKEENMTIVMVTHDEIVASYAQRRVVLKDGQIIEDSRNG